MGRWSLDGGEVSQNSSLEAVLNLIAFHSTLCGYIGSNLSIKCLRAYTQLRRAVSID